MKSDSQLINKRKRFLGEGYRLFYDNPLHPVRGEGVWLFDEENKRYLDAYNNVVSIGHCNPVVVEAICKQSAILNTHTRYLHEAIVEYAEQLLCYFPEELSNVTLTCSGSESNDLALRIAKEVTGGQIAIVTDWAYHGTTTEISALSPCLGRGVGASVRVIDGPNTLRNPGAWLESLGTVLKQLKLEGKKPAALMLDTIFASDGIFTPPFYEVQKAVEMVREAGGLFIADEVQAGFARTGEHYWGFERYDIIPDLVTLGKPMGNGHPIAGVVGRPELFTYFGQRQRYFNTFGGNPVSCRAAQAVLNVIERESLLQNSERQGSYMKKCFEMLAKKYPQIGDVRGSGLYLGIELVIDSKSLLPDPLLASYIVNSMRETGVLISAVGRESNVLKIRPPLISERKHVDMIIDAFEKNIKKYY